MTNHEIKISFEEYASLKDLNKNDQDLCLEAATDPKNYPSPYSKFRVAAALLLQSAKIVHGSNQENVAYPSGLCAERVALFHWGANHPNDPIESMAVTAHTDEFELKRPVTSCGSCLQVLAECEKMQKQPVKVMLFTA